MTEQIDELPIFVSLCEVNVCDCCGKSNLKRSMKLDSVYFNAVHLGVVCCGRWFNVNLRGNPYKAATRLQYKINSLSIDEVNSVLEDIKEAAQEWRG